MRYLAALVLANFISCPLLAAHFQYVENGNGFELWHYRQKIDHGSSETGRFAQRVFIQRKFSKNMQSPIFFKICGEASCSGYFSSLEEESAKRFQGILVAVEHRYYGASHPFRQLTVSNLKYLNTAQALEDLASVIGDLRSELNMSGPLILIGCSYAGNLAAYLRALKPELSAGAVALSAPVKAKTLLPEADRFNSEVIGPQCAGKLRAQLRLFESMILSMSDEEFQQTLKAVHLTTVNAGRETVIEFLGDMVTGWVGGGKHKIFCGRLGDHPLNLAPLIEAFGRYNEYSNKHEDSFEQAEEISTDKIGVHGNIRQWLYQTCSEYGYFQISDPTEGVGPLAKNASFKAGICRRLFGFTSLPRAESLNRRYLEKIRTTASRIVFANSKRDFWSQLSIRPDNNSNPHLAAVLAEEGGHCSASWDIKHGKPGTQAQFILERLSRWLPN